MDVIAVEAAARRAVAAIRDGGGPYFLECRTYRFRAHSMFDPQLYRTKAEIEEWKRAAIRSSAFANGSTTDHFIAGEEIAAIEARGRRRDRRGGRLRRGGDAGAGRATSNFSSYMEEPQ